MSAARDKLLIRLASCPTPDLELLQNEGERPETGDSGIARVVAAKIATAILEYRAAERAAVDLGQRKPYEAPAILETRTLSGPECAELGIMNPSIEGPPWTCDNGHAVHGYGFCHLCRFGTEPIR